jgi:hypothetical protein
VAVAFVWPWGGPAVSIYHPIHKSLARQLDVIASLFDVDTIVLVAFLVDSNLDAAGLNGREFVGGFRFIATDANIIHNSTDHDLLAIEGAAVKALLVSARFKLQFTDEDAVERCNGTVLLLIMNSAWCRNRRKALLVPIGTRYIRPSCNQSTVISMDLIVSRLDPVPKRTKCQRGRAVTSTAARYKADFERCVSTLSSIGCIRNATD